MWSELKSDDRDHSKQVLEQNRLACASFDTQRLTRLIEVAYATKWKVHQRSERPQNFSVDLI